MSIELGDLVYVCRPVNSPTSILTGKVGRVKCSKGGSWGVVFDEPIGGSDLDGQCLFPYGYFLVPQNLQKMEPLSALLRKQWTKEWEPKLRSKELKNEPVIFLEE